MLDIPWPHPDPWFLPKEKLQFSNRMWFKSMTLTFERYTSNPLPHPEQTIERYFQTFNQGDFLATSRLFAETGRLLPPFEEPIIGQDAIHTYLMQEANGMQATPKESSVECLEGNNRRFIIRGSVKAIVFSVNVAWYFDLDSQGKIRQVQVKLLASLQDLVSLRPDVH